MRAAVQVIELSEKGLSTKVIALANAAWIRYMAGRMPETGEAILGVSSVGNLFDSDCRMEYRNIHISNYTEFAK